LRRSPAIPIALGALVAWLGGGCVGNGGGWDGGWDGDPGDGYGRENARRSCVTLADRRGLDVERVHDVRHRGGGRYEVFMRVDVPRGGRQDLSCGYDERSGRTWLEDFEGGGDRPDPDDARRARGECVQEGRRRGHDVVDVASVEYAGEDRYRVSLVTRRKSKTRRVDCVYDADRREAWLP
jgi:hypothetical protein